MSKNKTIKVAAIDPENFERIKVEETKVVNLSDLGNIGSSIDSELSKLSKKELKYRLKYEETDPVVIAKIKKLLENM